MSAPNTGGPAFPTHPNRDDPPAYSAGMTLRDWFAGQAFSAAYQRATEIPVGDYRPRTTTEEAAHIAYIMADAMLAERAK